MNPVWSKHFNVVYQFNKDRELLFQVWNYNDKTSRDLIGEIECRLTDIMMAPNQRIERKLTIKTKPGVTRGILVIFADNVKITSDVIKFQIQGSLSSKKFLCFGSDNPYLMIERARQNNQKDFVRVLQTQYKFEDTKPWWDAHQMTMADFCNNNKYLPLRFSVYSYTNSGDHPKYGSVECTLKQIEMLGESSLPIKKNGKNKGWIKFNTLQMDMRPSLVEYLKQGWKIDVSIAVDFSLSNLEINDYRSLHRVNSNGDMNQYEKALFEVCNVMMPYARDGLFKVYGFGGMPIYTGQ